MRLQQLLLTGILVSVVGCADVVGMSEKTRPAVNPRLSETAEEYDPPTEWPVRIRSAFAGAFLSGEVVGKMYYDAYHASIAGSATVTDDRGGSTFHFSPQEQNNFFGFIGNTLEYSWHVPIQRECGTNVRADLNFRAWWQGIGQSGQYALLSASESRVANVEQPSCPTQDVEEPAPSGSGEGGGPVRAPEDQTQHVTTCVVRYTYDLNTGEVLSWRILYCY